MIAAVLLAAAPAWTDHPGAAVLEAKTDAAIVAWLPTRGEDGSRGIALLVASATPGERRLLRLDLDRARPQLTPVDSPPLPDDAVLLAPPIGPAGATTLLAAREGAIDRLDAAGTPRWTPWLADPALRWLRTVRVDPAPDGGALVRAAGAGSMVAWRVTTGGTTRLGEAALPLEVRRESNGLLLVSPAPSTVAGRLVTPPEAAGSERIRVYAAASEPWPPAFEPCWGRLPAPERVIDRGIVALDGEPHAVVTTIDGTKLEFFGEKRLRLFPLRPDRTRTGVEPRLASETGMNLWQSATFIGRDLNGDGRDDLAIAYWKGLRSVKAAIEVRLADGAGGFGPARRTEVGADEKEPGWLGFDRDLDGDGVGDLALVVGGRLKIFRGRPTEDGRRVVESTPSVDLPVGEPATAVFAVSIGQGGVDGGTMGDGASVRAEDVDGDGAPEIVVVSGGTIAVVVPKRSR